MASVAPTILPPTSSLQRPAVLWVILSGILLFVLLAAYASSWQNDRRASSDFEHAIERYQVEVERQLRGLQAATLSIATGVAVGTEPVSRARFERLAAALNATEALGVVGAVTLLDQVEDREIPAWRARAQRQYPELELQPGWEGTQPDERLLVRNRWPIRMAYDAIGRNMGSQVQRVAAAAVADGSALPVLSQSFVESTPDGPLKAYVMMAPVGPFFDTNPSQRHAPQFVPALRDSGTRQWVSLLVAADELFRKPLAALDTPLSVHVVDVDAPDAVIQLVFASHDDRGLRAARLNDSRTLSSMGRKWHLTYASTPAFEAAHRDLATTAIGLAGLFVGLGVLLAFLQLRRAEQSASTERARSEARFEQLNAILPIGVFEADCTGGLTDANAAACALATAPRGSLLGRGYLRRIDAADRRWLLDKWRTFRSDGAPFHAEHRLRGDDGCTRWVLTEVVRQEGIDRSVPTFVGTCVDISQRRAFEIDLLDAQRRATEAEARLTAAIDVVDAGFALYGPDHRLVMSNAGMRRFIGIGGGELRVGMHRDEVHRLLYPALSGGTDPDGVSAFRQRRVALDQSGSGTFEERLGVRWFRVTRQLTACGDVISVRFEFTEQKLRELEIQKLAAVASQTADGVALLDRTGRIEWVNAAYERLTGYALDEIRGMRGREFLCGPMTDPLTSSTIAASTDAGVACQMQIIHYTKQREPVWFELRNQPLLDATGQPIGLVQTRVDISQRKAAEAAASAALSEQARAESRLRESIGALDAGFSLFDESERLVVANHLYLRMFGTAARNVVPGMLKIDLLALLWQQAVASSGSTGTPPGREAWIDARLSEFRAADGCSEYPIGARWYSTSHRRTPAGDVVALRIDITESRAREQEHRRLAMVARETNDGVQILDPSGCATWVNPAFERLTGHTLEQVRGHHASEYLSGPDTDPATVARIDSLLASLQPYHVEILNYTRAGKPGWWEVRGQPLSDDNGAHLGYFQTRFDITARKTAEAAAATALAEQQRAETRLVQAIESLDEAFSLFDQNERLVLFNERNRTLSGDSACHIHIGMTRREMLEVIVDSHMPASASPADRADFIECRLAEHRSGNSDAERKIGDRWHRVHLRRTPLGDVVVTRIDITEAREREAQLAKLSLVASRTANSVVITDAANRIEWVNESFERQTGYSMDEVLGRVPGVLLAGPLTDTALAADMNRSVRQGIACQIEIINYRKNGEPYWVSIERQPIRDEQGRLVRWIRLSLDVSARKRAELALRTSEMKNRMLASVVQQTTTAVVTKDLDNRITTWNRGAERLYGHTAEQAIGRVSHELVNPGATPEHVKRLFEQLRSGSVDLHLVLNNVRADGTCIDVEASHAPQFDEHGTLVGRITVTRNITEQLRAQRSSKRAELALRASEMKNRMLASVVQQTTTAVITKDLDNRITTWNRGAEQIYGHTAEQAVGHVSHELLNPGATPEHVKRLFEQLRSGSVDLLFLQNNVRADGTFIEIEASHAPQFDEHGTLVGRITVVRDLAEQLRAQRSIEAARVAAEHAEQAMSSFLSNMSHELRTPMHAILSYARLGQDRIVRGTPEKTRQYLDRIEQSGVRLLALLNDLLDLSRLEAGRHPIDPGRHDLAMTVDAAILEVASLAQARQLCIARAGQRSLPAWYDPARIAQVLSNVVGNAVKFGTPGGTITVTLGQCPGPDGRPRAELVVADTGIGIPEGERETIFDKFVQSSKTRTGAGGTGLGLAISRELIHAHGGEIRAEHNPGGGTRFIITLPQEPPAGRGVPVLAGAPADAAESRSPRRLSRDGRAAAPLKIV